MANFIGITVVTLNPDFIAEFRKGHENTSDEAPASTGVATEGATDSVPSAVDAQNIINAYFSVLP